MHRNAARAGGSGLPERGVVALPRSRSDGFAAPSATVTGCPGDRGQIARDHGRLNHGCLIHGRSWRRCRACCLARCVLRAGVRRHRAGRASQRRQPGRPLAHGLAISGWPRCRPGGGAVLAAAAGDRAAGVGAWLGAAGLGMAIRVLAGQGTAAAFIVVAAAFLALFLLGWRAVAVVGSHLWRKSHSYAQRG